jgi:hypothetical protein
MERAELELKSVIRIQSTWKGFIARKKLKVGKLSTRPATN